MRRVKLLSAILDLFDGEGGGTGETNSSPADTQQDNTGEAPAGTGEAPAAGEKEQAGGQQPKAATPEERKKTFRDLINGEYKDLYTEATQKMINRRFGETKALQEKLDRSQPVLEMMMDRYGIQDGDMDKLKGALESDRAYWSAAAEEAGMDEAQYRQYQALKRTEREKNAAMEELQQYKRSIEQDRAAEEQMRKWNEEAAAIKATYPDFDLRTELENESFRNLLRVVPMEHAYKTVHLDDIVTGKVREAEKKVTDNIRATGNRPAENGSSSGSTFINKNDPSKWTDAQFEQVLRDVRNGKQVIL